MSKDKKGGIFSSKRFKYGSVSAVLTAVFVAFVILFNAVFGVLGDKFGFTLDLTDNQIYGIGDTTRNLLKDLDKEVSIKFMTPLDQLESSMYYPVVTCAQIYEREFEKVKVEYLDIITHPENLSYFTGKGYSVSTTDVIIQCGDLFEIYSLSKFLPIAESTQEIFGFRGEAYFTSSIISVTQENKSAVTFTTNHGEAESPNLEEIFKLCGYSVNRVDLSTQNISEDTDILVIYDPQYDFQSSSEGDSEIDKLTEFLAAHKNVMIFMGPSTKPMPNLDEVMEEWGITVSRNQVIQDDERSVPNYKMNIFADYTPSQSEELTSATEIIGNIGSTDSNSYTNTVLRDTAPILLSEPGSFRQVESVLKSSAASYVEDINGIKQSDAFTVMAISTRTRMENLGNSNNIEHKSHILVCSSVKYDDYCSGDSPYANGTLIYNAIKLMSDDETFTGISMKRVDDTTMQIDSQTAYRYTVIMASVLPGLVVIFGVVVWVKRKHL